MSDLSAFMAENIIQVENVKYVASKRIINKKTGKPVEWEIKAISSEEDALLRRAATRRVAINAKRNQYQNETDYDEYLAKLAVTCIVYPNLHDEVVQNSHKVMGAEALLKKMLLPAEYSDLLLKVQEINGFDISMEDTVKQAKN